MNTGVINIEDAYYFHNGKLNKTKNIIEKIADDYKTYGIKYLDDSFKRMENNEFLNIGLKYVSDLSNEPKVLKTELEDELKKAKYQLTKIEHPQYIELKRLLTNVKYGDKSERQGIPKLAYELIEYYCNKKPDAYCK